MNLPLTHLAEAWLSPLLAQKGEVASGALLELEQFTLLTNKHADLRRFLLAPNNNKKTRTDFLNKIGLSSAVVLILNWFVGLRRLDLLFPFIKKAKHLLAKASQKLDVEIVSAVTLQEAEKTQLKDTLEKKTQRSINLITKLDPKIMGGLIVSYDKEHFDLSVKGRLNQLRFISVQ